MEEEVNVLEKTIKVVEKYGFWKVLKAIFIIGCVVYVMYNGINVNNIVQEVFLEKQAEHEAALERRKDVDPQVRLILKELLAQTNADRAFAIEFHNGTNNTHGLSFFYGEMSYEEVREGTPSIDEDYQNINLSRFPFATYVCDNAFWYGSVEDLKKIDSKFAMRLVSNDVNYLAIRTMYGTNGEMGFLGVTYTADKHPDECVVQNIMRDIDIANGKLILMLDFNQVYKNY